MSGFVKFLENEKKPRGWILPNGDFYEFDNQEDHSGVSLKIARKHPDEFLEDGAVRVLWAGNEIVFEWGREKVSSKTKAKLIKMIKDMFSYGFDVYVEIHEPDFEDSFVKSFGVSEEKKLLLKVKQS